MSRPYCSPRRVQQAAATRRLIIDAARQVFAERGYAAATLANIARTAQVAVPTLYASVGGKPAILAALLERMDEQSDVATSRQALQRASDPAQVLDLAIDVTRRFEQDFGDIIGVFAAAAASEPEAAAFLQEGLRRRRAGMQAAAQHLAKLGALRPGISVEQAAETLGVLTAHGTWDAMVREYTWSWETAAAWASATARAAILAD